MKNINYTILFCFLFGFGFTSIGQNNDEILREVKSIAEERKEKVQNFLSSNNVPETYKEGEVIYEIHDVVNGKPIYVSTDNSGAASDTRTANLLPGGSMGLSLEGEDMIIGVWEVGGITNVDHVEYNESGEESRIIIKDNTSNATFHSTHVTGTIAANGINADAKGMAPKSTVWNYNTSNVTNELTDAIATGNILLSNHSYGVSIVQDSGNLPAEFMGSYGSDARQWDLLMNASPFHLAVFSAGNNGNDEYEGGLAPNYDKLTGEKNSKNNMVVANVASVTYFGNLVIANLNSSSSRGPSDDGRIKPDISGMGTNIFSTAHTENNAYATATGTSMSGPGVAGSLLLLQELYNNEYGQYLKSSTLKALALNTASDAGNTGPDASYGWGILHSERAANAILDKGNGESVISIQTLADGETFTFQVTAAGGQDIKAMIAWNDPAGTAINNTVNSPTPALVNDLDLRVKKDQNTFLPWKLQLSDVTAPAIKADNIVDNVEQVIVTNPVGGNVYDVEITHKGSLTNGQQEVSIIVTGISATTLSNENFNKDLELNYWPNPAADYINISFDEATLGKDAIIKVYDLTGKQVITEKISGKQGNAYQLDVSKLRQGTYIMNITSSNGSYNSKLIKK